MKNLIIIYNKIIAYAFGGVMEPFFNNMNKST